MKCLIPSFQNRFCSPTKPALRQHGGREFCQLSAVAALAIGLSFGTQAAELVVPSDALATIQEAVDVAAPGDTIKVLPGTYNEGVFVGTPNLKLEADTETGTVAVDSFLVLADDVEIKGFRVSDGVMVLSSVGGNVSHNTLSATGVGVLVLLSSAVHLEHNTVDSDIGIMVASCSDVHLDHNAVHASDIGVLLEDSAGTLVDYNSASGVNSGITISSSSGGSIEHNRVQGSYGILVRADSCGNGFYYNLSSGTVFGLYSEDAPSAPCNTYKNNAADKAFPSLKFWGTK